LNTPDGRAEFVRQLYNLRDMLEKDEAGDTYAKIAELEKKTNDYAKRHHLKTFSTQGNKRQRLDSNGQGPGGGPTGSTELRAHSYEVEPQVISNDNGIMESLVKVR
jgi:hypothetical protein